MAGQYEYTSSGPSFAVRVFRELFAPANAKDAKRPIRRVIRKSIYCTLAIAASTFSLVWCSAIVSPTLLELTSVDISDIHMTGVFKNPIVSSIESIAVIPDRRIARWFVFAQAYGPTRESSYSFQFAGLKLEFHASEPWHCVIAPRSTWQSKELSQMIFYATIPFWMPVAVFGTPPMLAFVLGPFRRALRGKPGHCRKCGYCLTGLVEHRCPECGTGFSN